MRQPWAHQAEGVQLLVRGSGAAWFDPRLGKTDTALWALQLLDGAEAVDRVCVVGSVNAKEVWRRELGEMMPYWPVELLEKLTPHPLAAGTRAVVINPNILDPTVRRGQMFRGWLRTLVEWAGQGRLVLILDECHKYASNPRSAEYKAIKHLARCATIVWELTGTYYERSALDAHHQLQLLGDRYPLKWKTDQQFGATFCNDKMVFTRKMQPGETRAHFLADAKHQYAGIKEGAELELMRVLEGVVLRRRRDECLDVPQTRILPIWVDHHDQQVELRRDEMERLRSELILLKAQRTIEYVQELKERPVIVFGWHVKLLQHLANHFRAPLIDGSTGRGKRVEIQAEFNVGTHPVLVCTLGIDAVDLARADHCVYSEVDWSATRLRQSMDRIVNGNKKRETVAHMLLVSGSVEEVVWDRILMKGEAIERLDLAARQLRELGLDMAELSS